MSRTRRQQQQQQQQHLVRDRFRQAPWLCFLEAEAACPPSIRALPVGACEVPQLQPEVAAQAPPPSSRLMMLASRQLRQQLQHQLAAQFVWCRWASIQQR